MSDEQINILALYMRFLLLEVLLHSTARWCPSSTTEIGSLGLNIHRRTTILIDIASLYAVTYWCLLE